MTADSGPSMVTWGSMIRVLCGEEVVAEEIKIIVTGLAGVVSLVSVLDFRARHWKATHSGDSYHGRNGTRFLGS